MKKTSISALILVLMLSLFVVACSDRSEAEEPEDAAKNEEKEATKNDEEEEEEEESVIPEDEDLFSVLKENMQLMQGDDINGYLETIHSDSPAYDSEKEIMEQTKDYTVDAKVSDLSVEEKSEEEAIVNVTQTTKVDSADFQDNEVKGAVTLKPDDGVWKVYEMEIIETFALDEDGEIMEEAGMEDEVVMEGEYADILTDLEMPFGEDWFLIDYQEEDGEGIAEFTRMDERQDSLSLHYIEDGEELLGAEGLIDSIHENLSDMITGDLEFNKDEVTDKEALYELTVKDDEVQYDQEEIGRAFVQDGGLFIIRYTILEDTIEDKDDWFDKFKQVK